MTEQKQENLLWREHEMDNHIIKIPIIERLFIKIKKSTPLQPVNDCRISFNSLTATNNKNITEVK